MKKLSPRGIGLLVGLGAIAAAAGIPLLINQADAANLVGPLTIVVNPGSTTPAVGGSGNDSFGLRFPGGTGSCRGDSATAGYRIQSFMVPQSVDPGALTYDANG